jgi:hypothetical protein
MQSFKIDQEFKSYLPALTKEERSTLEAEIEKSQHIDPLVLLQLPGEDEPILGDGHTRFDIAEEKHLKIPTRKIELPSREAALLWIIQNQFGRRNATPEQKLYYLGKERELTRSSNSAPVGEESGKFCPIPPQQGGNKTAAELASEHGVSERTVKNATQFAAGVDAAAAEQGDGARSVILNGQSGQTIAQISGGGKPILCPQCKKNGVVVGCASCEDKRKKARKRNLGKGSGKKKSKTLSEQTDEDLNQEPEAPEDETTEQQIKRLNSKLESWCRQLMKFTETMPDDPWLLDMDRRKSAINKLKSVCETVRSAKCHCACPLCRGEGCKQCHKTGRVTRYAYDQMGVK